MAQSLQDQLRALGLAKKPERRKPPRRRKPPAGTPKERSESEEIALAKAYALREQAEQREADRERKRKQAEDRRRREINQKIRAIVEARRLNVADAEVPRHFLFRGRIRKLYVTPEQNRALTAGELGLVYLTGGYHVLDGAALDEVRGIDPEHVVDLGGAADDEDEIPVSEHRE
jgi:uncharacterized protein YaiL (DUF2058 family)